MNELSELTEYTFLNKPQVFYKKEDVEKLLSNQQQLMVNQPTCGHCVDCRCYEKIDDTEPGNAETFWEQCKHKGFNEVLVWDCEKTGCTNFESK